MSDLWPYEEVDSIHSMIIVSAVNSGYVRRQLESGQISCWQILHVRIYRPVTTKLASCKKRIILCYWLWCIWPCYWVVLFWNSIWEEGCLLWNSIWEGGRRFTRTGLMPKVLLYFSAKSIGHSFSRTGPPKANARSGVVQGGIYLCEGLRFTAQALYDLDNDPSALLTRISCYFVTWNLKNTTFMQVCVHGEKTWSLSLKFLIARWSRVDRIAHCRALGRWPWEPGFKLRSRWVHFVSLSSSCIHTLPTTATTSRMT